MTSSSGRLRSFRSSRHYVSSSYDDSGQIFTEQNCKPAPMGATWTSRTRGSSKEFENFLSPGPGCASLWDMAVRTLLQNLDSLNSDVLAGIPVPVLERMWEKVEKR